MPKKQKRIRKPAGNSQKQLKPKGVRANRPGQIFEVDLKHLVTPDGNKRYALCVIDVFTRRAFVMISSTASASMAARAYKLATQTLTTPDIVITDHGSENLGKFAKNLLESPATHYFARVRQLRR